MWGKKVLPGKMLLFNTKWLMDNVEMWIELKKFYSKLFVACTNKHFIVVQPSVSRFVSLFLIKQKAKRFSVFLS